MISEILNGLAFGGLLFVLASGFSLSVGILKVVNIAHGALYMLSVYIALTITGLVPNFLVVLVVTAVSIGVLGVFIHLVVLRRLGLDPLPQVLATFGVLLIVVESVRLIWGGYPVTLRAPAQLAGAVVQGAIIIPRYRVFLFVAAVVLAIILWYGFERTLLGAFVRASVDDEDVARSIGINIRNVHSLLFALAGLLAGAAGALGGPVLGAYRGVEFEVLTLTLVVVVIGGIGSVGGTFLGAMIVGIIDSVGKVYFPELAYFVLFVPMVLILTLKPAGLLGKIRVAR